WSAATPLRRELVKVSAFFLRNWRMTRRNAFTIFEIVFWPIVNLLSVGLLITFVGAEPGTVVFVLVGTFALSTVQVCQLDVAYAALFDMWSKSIKHQLVAPIRPWHLVLGSWLMGLVRGTAVFALQAAVSHWAFGVNLLAHGPGPAGGGVSLILLLCGVYYPVSVLPAPLQAVAAAVPLTHVLEAFRAQLGYAPLFSAPLLRGYALAILYVAGGYALFAWSIHRARRTGMLLKLSD